MSDFDCQGLIVGHTMLIFDLAVLNVTDNLV